MSSTGSLSKQWAYNYARVGVSNSKPFQPNPSCFRHFWSTRKPVPEFRKPRVSSSKLGTTWNYSEQIGSNLTKGDSGMCTAVAHHPFSHVPFTLLPVKLSSSLFLAHIYTFSTQSFPSVILPPSGSWLRYVFILTVLVTILIVLAWALLPSI